MTPRRFSLTLIVLMLTAFQHSAIADQPTTRPIAAFTRPATRPATTRPATRPAVHVLTREEKSRIVEINERIGEISQEQRKIAAGIREARQDRFTGGRTQIALRNQSATLKAEQIELAQELRDIRQGRWRPAIPPSETDHLKNVQAAVPGRTPEQAAAIHKAILEHRVMVGMLMSEAAQALTYEDEPGYFYNTFGPKEITDNVNGPKRYQWTVIISDAGGGPGRVLQRVEAEVDAKQKITFVYSAP